MFKRFSAVMLAGVVLLSAFGIQQAGAQTSSDQATEKIKAKVQKLGTGTNAKVEVKLRDNSQMRGYITDSNQDSFTMFDKNSGANKTVSYADATQVKKSSGAFSTKSLIIIGAVAAGAVITWFAVKPVLCDGSPHTHGPC
ncbi:MAG TPA: hypothetical protein VLL54_18865 [Pyrinomonadaceae bacterium]|nr:hypothetical protein [Pyrinomonadaceae bacterium]